MLDDSTESRSDLLDFTASTSSTGTVPSSPPLVLPIPSAASPFSLASTTASSIFQFPPNRRSTFESRHLTPGVAIIVKSVFPTEVDPCLVKAHESIDMTKEIEVGDEEKVV